MGTLGSVSFDIVGTAQTPVNRTSTTVSFSGVAGATLSSIRYNDYNTKPIVFTSDEDGVSKIYAMNQNSGQRTRLLDPAFTSAQADPFPFPNGQSYAFSQLNGSGKWQLSFGFFGLTGLISNLGSTNGFNNEDPCIDPSGNLAYFVCDQDGNKEIWQIDLDTLVRSQVTTTAVGVTNKAPIVSSNGLWLAYQSNRDGNNEIYVRRVGTTDETRITNNAADDIEPSFSPNGIHIAYASNRSGNYDIYRAILTNGNLTSQLTSDTSNDRQPTFSPDGSKIFFTSERDDTAAPVSTEIYSMTATGGSQTRISVDSSYNQKAPMIASYLSPSLSYLGLTSIASGIIVCHNNSNLVSMLTFDIPSATDANRALTRVTSETLNSPSVPVIYYTISTPTSISSIKWTPPAVNIFPDATTLTPINTATDALITYSASGPSAGQIMAILPYAANRSRLKKRIENGQLVVEGSFGELYDSNGKNIAPHGASEVRFDSNGVPVLIK